MSTWAEPLWRTVGLVGVGCFVLLIVLVFVARRWFNSSDVKQAKRSIEVLGNVGGSRVRREAETELRRRHML